ncbi:MAG: hypothetical protein WEA76_04960 [Acidimicrobiia bacterium]
MRTIDFQAIQDNPTAADIAEEIQAIIASRLNPGNATLTTDTHGDLDGTRVQIKATVRDDSEQGRVEGDGLVHEVQVDDISDFENPAVSWRMRGSDGVTIDGYGLTAEGAFDDGHRKMTQCLECLSAPAAM